MAICNMRQSVEEKYNSSLSNVQTLTNSMTEIENQVSEVKRDMDGLEGRAAWLLGLAS